MNARRFFLLSVMAMGFLGLSSCAQMGHTRAPQAGQVEHIVLVWLKHPGNAGERAELVEAGRTLKAIPGVISVSGGDPIPSKRPIVDSSFDVGFVIRFENAAAAEAYQTHPQHVKLVKEVLKPAAKKIVIYDFTVR